MGKTTRREFAVQCGSVAGAVSLGQILASSEAAAATGQFEVSIDVLGLNALVLDQRRKRAEILLVDTKGLGMPAHTPFLAASLRDVTNPLQDSRPTTTIAVPSQAGGGVQQIGLWHLSDTQVVVRRPGGAEVADGITANLESGDAISSPVNVDDPEGWRDLRYVADLKRICGEGTLASGLSSLDALEVRTPPPLVQGRVRLGGGVLEGVIPSEEIHRKAVFEFVTGDGRAYAQPLTDTFRWRLSADAGATGNYLTLDLVPLRDNGQRTRTLMLTNQGRACRLSLTSLPTQHAAHSVSDEQAAALHFRAYYELLGQIPAERPMPRLLVSRERRATGGWAGPICPPAQFQIS